MDMPARIPLAAKRPRGRPRKTREELDDGNRRREVLHSAARLFRKKGFHATSTRDIAAAAGMQSGSPVYHFESKGALLFAVMEEGMRNAIDRQQLALEVAGEDFVLHAATEHGIVGARRREHLIHDLRRQAGLHPEQQ